MKIGVLKEVLIGERRVATTPQVCKKIIGLGFEIWVEAGAGEAANFTDDSYQAAGATVVQSAKEIWQQCDIILKVRPPQEHSDLGVHETSLMRSEQTLISFISPGLNKDLLQQLSEKGGNVLAIDSVPRMSRSQKMDALSSMANIAGYRAVIEAAQNFARFFAGQITAAGKIDPAKVLVIGAGVAGLSAIGTAKNMGAIVRAFDTRPVVKEQVESMDAEFLMLDIEEDGTGSGGYAKVMSDEFIKAEMVLFAKQAEEVDIIITTALIPGRPAPELITEDMVKSMQEGSVIVDLAAEQGGNCKLTEEGKVVRKHGVTLVGYSDLPSRLPTQSSQLYATNLYHLLSELCPEKNGAININMEDEVIRGATVIHAGEITWPPPEPKLSVSPGSPSAAKPEAQVVSEKSVVKGNATGPIIAFLLGALSLLFLGLYAPPSFMAHFTVFVLACFVGYMVIWNVTPSLHTPLMSVTNAISSIIIIGALLQLSSSNIGIVILSIVAILITSINIFGGFAVTQRMLRMFRR